MRRRMTDDGDDDEEEEDDFQLNCTKMIATEQR